MEEELVKELAEYAHKSWAGWMDYLFSKSGQYANGSVIIPPDLADRWKRQAATPYRKLPESEKESDRDEARKMLKIIQGSNL